jgi:uncharacterized protein
VVEVSAGARYPQQVPIDAYGNGGFRFAGISHKGSLICLPGGIQAWNVTDPGELTVTSFARVLDELRPPAFLLLGTGTRQVFPDLAVRRAFEAVKIALEVMDTGAACRTYNVLLAELRPVAAALIAVE